MNPQKIISLQAENVKRLNAVYIEPTGNVVVIGGNNGEGKTSVLDSIWYGMGGKSAICEKPVKEGKEEASIRIETTDLVVTRIIKPDGSTSLKVVGKDGGKFGTPQTILDNLVGALSFDPMAFARMEPGKRRITLQQLVGLDFSALDRQKAAYVEQRVSVGQIGERIKGQLAGMPVYEGLPAEELKIYDLSSKISEARVHNNELEAATRAAAEWNTQVEKLAKELENATHRRDAYKKVLDEKKPVDVAALQEELRKAEETNTKVRQMKKKGETEAELLARRDEYANIQAAIKALDDKKAAQLAAAKMPIEGLSVDDRGVTLAGIPFEQLSAAEQQRVSLSMGFALNPGLRAIFLRDASLMDAKTLAMVGAMAAEKDCQVWLERVGDGEVGAIVIEDGYVKGAPEPKPIAQKEAEAKLVAPQRPKPPSPEPASPSIFDEPLPPRESGDPHREPSPARKFGRPGRRS